VTVLLGDGVPPTISEDPIIAFKITEMFPDPYTLDGKVETRWNTAIKCPDGKLNSQTDQAFENTEEFIAAVIKEKEEKAARGVTLVRP
jgi:hypothetical protein